MRYRICITAMPTRAVVGRKHTYCCKCSPAPVNYPLQPENRSWRSLKKIASAIFYPVSCAKKLQIRAQNLSRESRPRKEQCLSLKGLEMLCCNPKLCRFEFFFFLKGLIGEILQEREDLNLYSLVNSTDCRKCRFCWLCCTTQALTALCKEGIFL